MGASGNQSSQSSQSSQNTFIDKTQMGFLQDLWGDAQDATRSSRANRWSEQGGDWLKQAGRGMLALGNPQQQIEQQTAALKQGLGTMFTNELNPAIQKDAVGQGGFGGGRQGVAEGVAMSGIADAFTQGSADITAQANQQAMQALSSLPGIASARQGLATGGLQPYQMLSSILGSPTVLGQSESESEGESQGFGFNLIPF